MRVHIVYQGNGADNVRVHREGCRDVARELAGMRHTSDYVIDCPTRRAAAEDFWSDFIAEGSMTPDEARGYTKVLPCVGDLPEGEAGDQPDSGPELAQVTDPEPTPDTDTQNWSVGDGATLCLWTDRHAYTVVKLTAKTITIQRDKATPDPGWVRDFTPGGFMGHTSNDRDRKYTYERDPDGETRVARLTKAGWMTGGCRVVPGRREFYDSNF